MTAMEASRRGASQIAFHTWYLPKHYNAGRKHARLLSFHAPLRLSWLSGCCALKDVLLHHGYILKPVRKGTALIQSTAQVYSPCFKPRLASVKGFCTYANKIGSTTWKAALIHIPHKKGGNAEIETCFSFSFQVMAVSLLHYGCWWLT